MGSGMKSATWGGVKEQLTEGAALFRVVDQLWAWHLLSITDEQELRKARAKRQPSLMRNVVKVSMGAIVV